MTLCINLLCPYLGQSIYACIVSKINYLAIYICLFIHQPFQTKEEGKSLLRTISEKRAAFIDKQNQPADDEPKNDESIELCESPITPKPSCAVALNYNTPSPSQSADNSRYKM